MKKLMALVLTLVLALSLTACNDSGTNTNTNTGTNNDKKEEFIVGEIIQKNVGETIVDEELGRTITVLEVVKNVPADYLGSDKYFGVALKLRVERNSEMTLIGGLDFQLLVNGEKAKYAYITSSFSKYAEEQGWEELESNIPNGESREGWIIFRVTDSNAELTFRYARPELPVTVFGGENYTIPAENFDIKL